MRLMPLPPFHPRAFRIGVVPFISDAGLNAMRHALRRRPDLLVMGTSVSPPALAQFGSSAPVGACLVGIAGWLGERLGTALGVAEFFDETKNRSIDNKVLHLFAVFTAWWDSGLAPFAEKR